MRIASASPVTVSRWALDQLFPPRCVACGRFHTFLCDGCTRQIEPAFGAALRCPNCCARWAQPLNCDRCSHWSALDRGLAAVEMAGPARQVVHELKYRGVRRVAATMAEAMQPLREAAGFDIALPIPLHRSRVRSRGFNQAEVILRELGWPVAPGQLVRSRKTKTQVGLHLRERRSNVAGAFRYEGPELLGLTVAVVDDVITTGATANECAAVLRDFGARSVVAIAYARASHDGEHANE